MKTKEKECRTEKEEKKTQNSDHKKNEDGGFLNNIFRAFLSLIPDDEEDEDCHIMGERQKHLIDHRRIPPKVLLHNCDTPEQHYAYIDQILLTLRNQDLHGLDGLLACGFNYVTVHQDDDNDNHHDGKNNDEDEICSLDAATTATNTTNTTTTPVQKEYHHLKCSTKLYHIKTETFISMTNRESFIADGEMYEKIVQLCQEFAHDLMMKEVEFGNGEESSNIRGEKRKRGLKWISVCEDETKGNPIRILVDDNDNSTSTTRSRNIGNIRSSSDDGKDGDNDDDLSFAYLNADEDDLSFEDDNDNSSQHFNIRGMNSHNEKENHTTTTTSDDSDGNNLISDDEEEEDEDIIANDMATTLSQDEQDEVKQSIISATSDEDAINGHSYNDSNIKTEKGGEYSKADNKKNIHVQTNDDDKQRSILLITTGKGKVRGGIFSRQHLLVSSVESSTALPIIRDARIRGMKVAILDPNARGDRSGMTTYEQSMDVLFGNENHQKEVVNGGESSEAHNPSIHTTNEMKQGCFFHHQAPIYILAHSASGAQLTSYLMTQGQHLTSRIKSIVFTDSTHNVQWLKKKEEHHKISKLFQSPLSLYVRSSNEYRHDDWEKHKPGDICDAVDEHWIHRFGTVKTIWAGTKDHSLTNWTSHKDIWDHFDECQNKSKSNDTTSCPDK